SAAPMSEYRWKIIKADEHHRDQILKAAANEESLLTAIQEKIRTSDIQAELILTLNFYDALRTCGLSELCDRKTLNDLFYLRETEMHMNYYQHIGARRKSEHNFGCGLEHIALMSWNDDPCK